MNIIYIHTHDTGRYIQPYGYSIPTPNLMGLAKQGTIFRNAYCAGPTCSPSRTGLLTGMSPHTAGMIGLAHFGFELNDYSQHLVQYLKRHNYETALYGIQHEAPNVEMIGYDHVFEHGGRKLERDIENAKAAADYIKRKKDRPFFLSFGMINTHRTFPETSGEINPNYVIPPFPLYDNETNRKDMAAFMASAKVADDCAGLVLDALHTSGLEDNSIIIFTTDHGIAFPRMKCNLYDTGIGVSLIMKYPGNPKKGKAIDSLISQIDIFPTLCDMLHLEKPQWLQGKSFLQTLNGQADSTRGEIFSEVTFHAAYEPMRCIRTNRYKLIRLFDPNTSVIPANTDDSISKDFFIQNGYLDEVRDKDMLFDLYLDPVERINLISNDRYGDIYSDLSHRLDKWMRDTNDPLLSGKVDKPIGAKVIKRTSISPHSCNEKDYE